MAFYNPALLVSTMHTQMNQELNIDKSGNGLNGFSIEVGALFNKIRYTAYYQNNTAYDQFGLNLQLNKYFGLGKFGQRVHW